MVPCIQVDISSLCEARIFQVSSLQNCKIFLSLCRIEIIHHVTGICSIAFLQLFDAFQVAHCLDKYNCSFATIAFTRFCDFGRAIPYRFHLLSERITISRISCCSLVVTDLIIQCCFDGQISKQISKTFILPSKNIIPSTSWICIPGAQIPFCSGLVPCFSSCISPIFVMSTIRHSYCHCSSSLLFCASISIFCNKFIYFFLACSVIPDLIRLRVSRIRIQSRINSFCCIWLCCFCQYSF